MLGIPFEVKISDVEEIVAGTVPATVTEELSRQKAEAVAGELLLDETGEASDGWVVLGADTVVSLDGKILGKPKDEKEAYQMIRSLANRSHEVYTGVTLICKSREGVQRRTFSVCTKVMVADISEREIWDYIALGECTDKAGAYGIQGSFSRFIEKIEGDYFNVVGLPVHAVYQSLKDWHC